MAGRVAPDRDKDAVGEHRPPGRDSVGEVVGRLGRRVVVQRHPVLGSDRLGGHEPAVRRAEPALRGAVPIVVHAWPAGVADRDREDGSGRDRRGGRDHQLRCRALRPVERIYPGARGPQLGRAGRRQRVVVRTADRIGLRGFMGCRVRVILAVRVAGIGRLHEPECGRAAIHDDGLDSHVRAGARVLRLALEVEAEAGQALCRPVRQDHLVARQEPVRRCVVHQVHQRVLAGVAAVAGIGVQAAAWRGQGVRAGRAGGLAGSRGGGHGYAGQDQRGTRRCCNDQQSPARHRSS